MWTTSSLNSLDSRRGKSYTLPQSLLSIRVKFQGEDFIMKRISIALVVVSLSVFGFVTMAWQSEWNDIVETAKREGSVVVVGPQGNETREALTVGFQKKYPAIKVEHSSTAGAQLPPKLLAEQKAERYNVDLLVQGTTTVITGLMPVKAVIPIQPYLVGPNSRDSSAWFNKRFSFADEAAQYNLVMSVYIPAAVCL
jgi:ABC-type glycerol-3-phosphate transport system substrate-binding protein